MQAVVKQVSGITFVGKAGTNHWVVMDGTKLLGGSEAGTSPMELLLLALGGCTATDVAAILNRKKITMDSFEVHLSADRAETHPKVLTKIDIKYLFRGKNLPKTDIEEAINLSQTRYCSVSAMLKKAAELNYSYQINET